MNLIRWQPVEDVMDLGSLLNRSFRRNGFPQSTRAPQMALDIFETEDKLVVRATLPGVRKEDVTVEFEDHWLTVKAEVKRPELPEGANSLLQESLHGEVSRSIKIPQRLDTEHSKGTFLDGILEVTFPKTASTRKKAITID